MSNILTRRQAIEFLNIDDKTFDNYFKNANEFKALPRPNNRGFFKFDQNALKQWLADYKLRTIELTFEDYSKCLDFALAQHFKGYVISDWGTARQREFGQKITNWIKGQLAEVAVQKFFKKEFNTEIELDFEIYDKIVPQDIIAIVNNGEKRKPRIGVGIKSSKPKSAYLILSENEVVLDERKSDIYIFCRPNIPDDHLLRLAKERIIEAVQNQKHFPSYKDEIPEFKNMTCEIAGWCALGELEKVTSIPGQNFDNGFRFVKKTGDLHRSRQEWSHLISLL